MSLNQRRLLFYFFVLLFIIVVPVVLILATGRTINWQRLEFQKTATLIVDSNPSGASIFLNGQAPRNLSEQLFSGSASTTTKAKLTGLLPGTYTLRLELNGYTPWEQQVTLLAGQVFNTDILRLYLQAKPTLVIPLPASAVATIDGRTVSARQGRSLTVFQIPEHKKLELQLPADVQTDELSWSADGNSLLVGHDFIVSRNAVLLVNLQTSLTRIDLARWDQEDNILYIVSVAKLLKIDLRNGTPTTVRDLSPFGRLRDLQIRGGQIFLVAANSERTDLIILAESKLERDSRSQLMNGNYRFINAGRSASALLDESRHDLYLIERPLPIVFAYRLNLISQDYHLGSWNGKELIYATPFELRRWYDGDAEMLLTRWSEPITDLRVLPKDNQVLFTTATSLTIIPNGNHAFKPALTLVKAEHVYNLVSVEEKTAYFLGSIGGQSGLYNINF